MKSLTLANKGGSTVKIIGTVSGDPKTVHKHTIAYNPHSVKNDTAIINPICNAKYFWWIYIDYLRILIAECKIANSLNLFIHIDTNNCGLKVPGPY